MADIKPNGITGDTALINGRIITGDGSPAFEGMLIISGDQIQYAGGQLPFECRQVIDVERCVISPGFIDIHSHSDFLILLYPDAESKVLQGVTTEFTGNCGLSGAPLYGQAYDRWKNRWAKKNLDVDWQDPAEYFERIEQIKPGINIAPLLGHANIRTILKNYDSGDLSSQELNDFTALLEKYSDGFHGISLGLAYPPGIFAGEGELAQIFNFSAQKNLLVTVHMRDEGPEVEKSVAEMLNFAKKYETSLQISHLKTYGKNNWYKIDQILQSIEQQPDVHFDRYPFTAFNTDLDIVLPQQIFAGGQKNAAITLHDQKSYYRAYLETHFTPEDASNITITSCRDTSYIGKSLPEICGEQNLWEQLINFILEMDFEIEANFLLMSDVNLSKILHHDLCMIASDSAIRPYDDESNPHPRAYGTFPLFLQKMRVKMPIEQAVYKITGLPAKKFNLRMRGILKKGNFADIAVWNPDEIAYTGSYQSPKIRPQGFHSIWINGIQIMKNGELLATRAGKLLLR